MKKSFTTYVPPHKCAQMIFSTSFLSGIREYLPKFVQSFFHCSHLRVKLNTTLVRKSGVSMMLSPENEGKVSGKDLANFMNHNEHTQQRNYLIQHKTAKSAATSSALRKVWHTVCVWMFYPLRWI